MLQPGALVLLGETRARGRRKQRGRQNMHSMSKITRRKRGQRQTRLEEDQQSKPRDADPRVESTRVMKRRISLSKR